MVIGVAGHPHPAEYCHNDVFQALCHQDEVVVMETAKYGRMHLGDCVEMDMGYIGCSVDVLLLTDTMCSGKPKCEISVPHKEFDATELPCLKELKTS